MAKSSSRLVSLDIFRGLTIAFMIIVNTPGSWKYVYPPLKHAEWHGCTPTDLVFPFFLFIVGVSTCYSLKKYGNEINGSSIFRIFRRMVAIFAVGLVPYYFSVFWQGLFNTQNNGCSSANCTCIWYWCNYLSGSKKEYLWIVTAVLLLLYWGLLAFFGGADPYSLKGNFALKADLAILGKNHMYKGFGIPFDPEGLLSTIPAICTVIIGYFIGEMVGKGSASGKTVIKAAY